jgi:paraquat-inducible protein A
MTAATPTAPAAGAVAPGTGSAEAGPPDAAALGLRGCRHCGLVSRTPPGAPTEAGAPPCPRCGHALRARKPRSLQRTSAWLLAAAVLYVPANVLPVMSTSSVLGRYPHTLLGGIGELWQAGSPALAAIVFVASILVPVGKIAALSLLVLTARRRSRWRQRERARLYRMVEAVGHWSMLDVFVVVVLVGMLRFGPLGSVEPQPGLLAFGAVVVLTVLAASSFDPRLIWPVAEEAERGAGKRHPANDRDRPAEDRLVDGPLAEDRPTP